MLNKLKYIVCAKLFLKLALIIPLLSACGQKGPLYLPDENATNNPQATTTQSQLTVTTANAN
jgi:predicted small lipoprotein YifL